MKIKKANVINVLLLVFAGIINATGVALFLYPSSVIDGGISGLSLLISYLTNYTASIFIFCINLPFFILGLKRMGKSFIFKSLLAICSYSAAMYIFTKVLALHELVYNSLNKDMFLCAIFGGLVSGIGSGLTIRYGGAIDGIEVMAVLFSKKLGITVGQFVMVFNAIMYILASFLLNDLRIGLYSIVSYSIGLKAVDFMVEGFDKCKAAIIVTNKGDELAELISAKLGRGITLIEATGYFSKDEKTMMYCVVNRFEIGFLKKFITSIDPTAFVTISEISDIMGSEIKKENIFKRTRNLKKNK